MMSALSDRDQMLEGRSREAQKVTRALLAHRGREEEKIMGKAMMAMTAGTLRNVAKAKQLKQQQSTDRKHFTDTSATLLDTSTSPSLFIPSSSISIEELSFETSEQHGEPEHNAIVNQEPDARARKVNHNTNQEAGTTAPRSCESVQAPLGLPYCAPPAPYEDKSTPRQSPQPPSSACRPGKRKGTGNDQKKTGPREEPAISRRCDTRHPRSHERAQPPLGDSRRPQSTAAQAGTQCQKGHPSAEGSGNHRTAVDPGGLLARLEEQRRDVIQDEHQCEAAPQQRTNLIARE